MNPLCACLLVEGRIPNASAVFCYLNFITKRDYVCLLGCLEAELMKRADGQTLARAHKLEKEQEALALAHSELGVAAGELRAKLEVANSSHMEAAAARAASEARAAELEAVLASCRRELEAARNAASEAAAAKAALERRVAETGARVGELEAMLLATQKEVAALFLFVHPSAGTACHCDGLVGIAFGRALKRPSFPISSCIPA